MITWICPIDSCHWEANDSYPHMNLARAYHIAGFHTMTEILNLIDIFGARIRAAEAVCVLAGRTDMKRYGIAFTQAWHEWNEEYGEQPRLQPVEDLSQQIATLAELRAKRGESDNHEAG